jgi:hypothetical protein
LTSATLNGTVGAGPPSRAYFQYGSTTAYGGSTAGQALGRSGGTRAVAAPLGILVGVPYHFRLVTENSAGVSVGADQAFMGSSPGGKEANGGAPLAPVIMHASQSHRTWREGRRAAKISRRRPPVGTTFSFTLNEGANVAFSFTRKASGRRVRGRCLAPTHGNRHRRSCTRSLTVGSLSFLARIGVNRVLFQGSLSRAKRLAPGTYTLLITATSPAGLRSATSALTFTIVS